VCESDSAINESIERRFHAQGQRNFSYQEKNRGAFTADIVTSNAKRRAADLLASPRKVSSNRLRTKKTLPHLLSLSCLERLMNAGGANPVWRKPYVQTVPHDRIGSGCSDVEFGACCLTARCTFAPSIGRPA
jgi:hypothetical protein